MRGEYGVCEHKRPCSVRVCPTLLLEYSSLRFGVLLRGLCICPIIGNISRAAASYKTEAVSCLTPERDIYTFKQLYTHIQH